MYGRTYHNTSACTDDRHSEYNFLQHSWLRDDVYVQRICSVSIGKDKMR